MMVPAYILAGGKSSRFGSDKARALVNGTPMICRIAHTLAPQQVTIVADAGGKYADLGLNTIGDLNPGRGPMAGLQTAMQHAIRQGSSRLLLVSCDLVGIRCQWVEALLAVSEDADVVAYRGEFWEPLCAIYHTRIREEVNRRIACRELAMQSLCDSVRAIALPRPDDWAQANTPEDLAGHVFTALALGPLAQAAGGPQVQVRMGAPQATCAELRLAIAQQHPQLAPLLRSCRFAVGHAFAEESQIVRQDQEIALIGFVSGG